MMSQDDISMLIYVDIYVFSRQFYAKLYLKKYFSKIQQYL